MKARLSVLVWLLLTSLAANAADVELFKLSVSNDNNITVPQRALVMRNGIPGVFVAHDGEARFRMVRPGRVIKQKKGARQVVVLSGLFGNETLVLGKPQQLYDGLPLPQTHANGNH